MRHGPDVVLPVEVCCRPCGVRAGVVLLEREVSVPILFSDECRFVVHASDGRLRIWCRAGERVIDGLRPEQDPLGRCYAGYVI